MRSSVLRYARPRVWRTTVGVTALGALLLASACSGGSGGSGNGELDPDGVVRVVTPQTPVQFDPCGTLNGAEYAFQRTIYATVIKADPATGELSSGLATDWEFSADGLTLTVNLQEGLTFQDGTPLNAETAKQSLDQCLDQGVQAIPELKQITAEGPTTLIFELSSPNAGLPDLLSNRFGMLASPAARDSLGEGFASQPVGAGPYELTAFVPGSSVELTRWDDYKEAGLPKARAAKLEISTITDSSALVAALTGGTADYGYQLLPSAAASLEESPNLTTSVETGMSYAMINFDRSHGPTQDVRVRQAIAYALDRDAIAEATTYETVEDGAYQPFPEGHPFHVEDLNDSQGQDLAKARALLAEAGFEDGLSLRGVNLNQEYSVNGALIVSDQLAKVGIKVEFETKDLPEAVKGWYTDHDYDLFATGVNVGPDWLGVFQRALATQSAANSGNVPLPGGEEALTRLYAAKTDAELEPAIREATEVFVDQVPALPLARLPFVTAWTSNVVNAEDANSIVGEPELAQLGVTGAN